MLDILSGIAVSATSGRRETLQNLPGVVPEPGSLVWIRQRQWRVERATRIGDVVRLDVAARDRRLTFLAPFDRPVVARDFPRPRRVRRRALAARAAALVAHRESARLPLAALTARVALLPYQLEPCLAMLDGTRRVLIADEVGLGKTIQAGLLIAEAQRRRPSLRALIMVPAALREQWRQELLEKFGVACLLADRVTIDAAVQAGRFGDNPWHRPGVWLASVDYLRQTHVRDALPFIPWDVLVIDEAHAVCGDSERHAVSHDMARRARHVVLLSATPHSGDDRRFGRLEDLGALPDLTDELVLFRRTRATVAAHLTRRVHWQRLLLSTAERRLLDTLAAFEQAVVRAAGDARGADALLLLSIFRKRALSSTHALGISVDRRLTWIDRSERRAPLDWLQPSFSFDDRPQLEGDDDCEGLTRDSGLDVARERTWLRRLRVLAADAARTETKLAHLCRTAMRTTEPLVVFTEFRHSLDSIGRALGRVRDVSLLHGGMTEAERAAALRDFQQGRTSALVATDVASQGLNLQHRARWVVMFELPWNPARLEQRVGRVDRLGQTRRVHATLLTAAHSMEAGVLSRLAARAMHANDVLGGGMFDGFTPDTAVMRALIRGNPDVDSRPIETTVRQPSSRWRRTGKAAAWCLCRRRLLNQAWRASVPAGGRYLRCESWGAVREEPVALAVWTIPILEATGTTVERQLLVANVHQSAPDDPRQWMPAVELLARSRLAARARRLERLASQRARFGCAVERAIGTYLVTQQFPEFFQPELFHDRMVRAAAAGTRHREDIAHTAGARLREWEARSTLSSGRPSLEVLAGRRR